MRCRRLLSQLPESEGQLRGGSEECGGVEMAGGSGDEVERVAVQVEGPSDSSAVETGSSAYFFRPLRDLSASGKLEGLSVTSGGGGGAGSGAYDDELGGNARTLAICPGRGLLCSLSPGRAGFWVYGVDALIKAYQGEAVDGEAVGGCYTPLEGTSVATALEASSDESFLSVVCEDRVLFYSLLDIVEGDPAFPDKRLQLVRSFQVFGGVGEEKESVTSFRWGSLAGSPSFLAVSDRGALKIVSQGGSRTIRESGVECAAWSPDDAHVAYGSGKRLSVVRSDFSSAFDADLAHPDFEITINSVVWLSRDVCLAVCMTQECDDAEEEELAFCFTIRIALDANGRYAKAQVAMLDEDSACIALDEEGAPMGTGPYLHHCQVSAWNVSIIAHRKSVGDCSVSIIARDEDSSEYRSVEVLQDGFDDADSLRVAIPLRTDKDEGDDFIVGLQVYTRENKVRVKDPLKEAYSELEKSFPIVFAQTLSAKLFLFSFGPASDTAVLPCKDRVVPRSACSPEVLCSAIDGCAHEGGSSEEGAKEGDKSHEAALKQGLPESDSDDFDDEEEEEEVSTAPAVKKWPASFLAKNKEQNDSTAAAVAEEIEKAKSPAPSIAAAKPGVPTFKFGAPKTNQSPFSSSSFQQGSSPSISFGSFGAALPTSNKSESLTPTQSSAPAQLPTIKPVALSGEPSRESQEQSGAPAPAVKKWPASFLAKNKEQNDSTAAAVAEEIEKAKSPAPSIAAANPGVPTFNFGAPKAADTAAPSFGKVSFGSQAPTFGSGVKQEEKKGVIKVEAPSFKRAELSSPLLSKLQNSFVETLVEVRRMQQKCAASIKDKDCDALRSLSVSGVKKLTALGTQISKSKSDLEQSRGTVESLLQKLKVLEKKAQTYSTPSLEADSLHSITNTSIGSKRDEISNSFSALQEAVNDVTEFLEKCGSKMYKISSHSQGLHKQKSVHGIYSTINAQATLAKNQSLHLDDLRERLEDLKREKSSSRSGLLTSLTRKFGELMPAEEYAQHTSPWQVKERDFISSSILKAISKNPRITRIHKAPTQKIENIAVNNVSKVESQTTNQTKIVAAKSTGGAPMPPMPSFGQMKSAQQTMSTFLNKEEPKEKEETPAKPAAKTTGGAPMPPMPSFGQMKLAKDTMSTFLKKEDAPAKAPESPAKASTPAKTPEKVSTAFGSSPGAFGAASSAFGASSSEFGASSSSFGSASSGFGGSSSTFGASSGTFGASSGTFGASSGAFGASSGAFGASSGAFGASSSAFGKSSFGQAASISGFGQGASFGQSSPSVFGSSFGQSGTPPTPGSVSNSPFGQVAQQAGGSGFGAGGTGPASIAQFGKPAAAFGSLGGGPSPFAAFGSAQQPGFGQPASPGSSGFGGNAGFGSAGQSGFGGFGGGGQQQPGPAGAFGQPAPVGGFGGGGFGAPAEMQPTQAAGFSNKMRSNPSAWQPRR